MNYETALVEACSIRAVIAPLCLRCEIAGSVRRKKPTDIKDIEIVGLPNPVKAFALAEIANNRWGRPLMGLFPSKYTKVRGPRSIDFFWASEQVRWGLLLFIRTGPADYSQKALAHWKRITNGGYSKDCILHLADGTRVPTPEEKDVFAALKWPWVEPEKRL